MVSGYNLLRTELRCLHCLGAAEVEAEFRFGLLDFRRYVTGDRIEWARKGGSRRPADGDFRGEGYVECPLCGRDYWVTIGVRSDLIESVDIDLDRPGYIPGRNV